jgi:pimeloyl-ACP methyl ester carboxylesterase
MNRIAHPSRGPIEYRVAGQGPAALALNGGHTNANSPPGHERFFLEPGSQLIVPSRHGYGATPSAIGKTAKPQNRKSLCRRARWPPGSPCLERVNVLGISTSGPTALQVAGRHPDRVSLLILQNTVTGAQFPGSVTRPGAYLIFNRWTERWTWAAVQAKALVCTDEGLLAGRPLSLLGAAFRIICGSAVACAGQACDRDTPPMPIRRAASSHAARHTGGRVASQTPALAPRAAAR